MARIPAISPELLGLLVCPACDERPEVELSGNELRCPKCGRAYPVMEGIPVMLVERATRPEGWDGGSCCEDSHNPRSESEPAGNT